ncbi:MAG: glycosyltransferase family 4 protein [Saprospiraceae bacterium]
MKKVLIITYYWPPSGGGGVHRWLKMQKYLRNFGWQPIIFTPSNPEIGAEDISLLKDIRHDTEIITLPIWEPYTWYKTFTGKKSDAKVYNAFLTEGKKKAGWTQRIAEWVRGNFFIPDARKFWINPASKFLKNYLKQHPVDLIISTGPPHSMHLIAKKVEEAIGIPWIADFRDPWTKIDMYDKLKLTKMADTYHHYLEKSVLEQTDHVVAVTWAMAEEFKQLCPSIKVSVITNGYDVDDFNVKAVKQLNSPFVIRYLGSMNADRNPVDFWEALATIRAKNAVIFNNIVVELIGQIDTEVIATIEAMQLHKSVLIKPFIPHDAAIEAMINADLLLIVINKSQNQSGILPGKMYEYIGAGKPILCIGPSHSDAQKLFYQVDANYFVSYGDSNKIVSLIEKYITPTEQNKMSDNQTQKHTQFSRESLAKDYCELMNLVINNQL